MLEQLGSRNPQEEINSSGGRIVHAGLLSGDLSGNFELLTGTPGTWEGYVVTSIEVSSDEVRSEMAKERSSLAVGFDYAGYKNRPLFECLSPLIPSTDASGEALVSTTLNPSTFPALDRIPKIKGEKPKGFVPDPSVVKFTAFIKEHLLRDLPDIPDLEELILFQRRLICPSKSFFVVKPGIRDYDIQDFLRQQQPDESFSYPSGKAQREISLLLAQRLIFSFGNGIDLASELVAKATELGILLDLEDLHGAFSDLVSLDYCSTNAFKELTDIERDAYFQIIALWQLSLAVEINREKKSKNIDLTLFNVFPSSSLDGKLPVFAYWKHILSNTEKFIANLSSVIPTGYFVRLEQIDGIIKNLNELLLRALEATADSYLIDFKQAKPRQYGQMSLQSKLEHLKKENIQEAEAVFIQNMINFIGNISEKDHSKRRARLLDKVRAFHAKKIATEDFSYWERAWLGLEEWRAHYTTNAQQLDKRNATTTNSGSHLKTQRAQIEEITKAGGRETLAFKIKQFFRARRNAL